VCLPLVVAILAALGLGRAGGGTSGTSAPGSVPAALWKHVPATQLGSGLLRRSL
jgi:hypothetical protein